MMLLSQRSDQWNFRYPEGKPFEQRFAKDKSSPRQSEHISCGIYGFTVTNL